MIGRSTIGSIGFGHVVGERTQPRPLPADEHDPLHRQLLPVVVPDHAYFFFVPGVVVVVIADVVVVVLPFGSVVVVEVGTVDVVGSPCPVMRSSRSLTAREGGAGIGVPAGTKATVIISPFGDVDLRRVGRAVRDVTAVGEAHISATSVPLPLSGPVQLSPSVHVRWPLPG